MNLHKWADRSRNALVKQLESLRSPPPFEMWVRGHLYQIVGYVNPEQRDWRRAMADDDGMFVCADFKPLNGAPILQYHTLTMGDLAGIDAAFWDYVGGTLLDYKLKVWANADGHASRRSHNLFANLNRGPH